MSKTPKISKARAARLGVKAASIAAQRDKPPRTRDARGAIKSAADQAPAPDSNGDEPKTMQGAVTCIDGLLLQIGSRFSAELASLELVQDAYCRQRDESGEGASTFEAGEVFSRGTKIAVVSYNGRVWDMAGALILDRADVTEHSVDPAGAQPPVVEELPAAVPMELPLKAIRAALLIAPTNETSRFYLNGVHLRQLEDGSVRVVATDGHRLLVQSEAARDPIEWLQAGVIIPAEQLGRVVKFLGKDAGLLRIAYATGRPRLELSCETDTLAVFSVQPLEGSYPDYQRIVDSNAAMLLTGERADLETAQLDGGYLKSAAAVAAALESKSVLPFIGADDKCPVLFTFSGAPQAALYIMPQRQEKDAALAAPTVKLFGSAAMEATLTALRSKLKVSQENAKRTKIAKFKQQSEDKCARIKLRIEQIEAVLRPKIAAPSPESAPAAAAESGQEAAH